jgi:hypothetical protein
MKLTFDIFGPSCSTMLRPSPASQQSFARRSVREIIRGNMAPMKENGAIASAKLSMNS